jgi:hypothetical protein
MLFAARPRDRRMKRPHLSRVAEWHSRQILARELWLPSDSCRLLHLQNESRRSQVVPISLIGHPDASDKLTLMQVIVTVLTTKPPSFSSCRSTRSAVRGRRRCFASSVAIDIVLDDNVPSSGPASSATAMHHAADLKDSNSGTYQSRSLLPAS